MVEFETRCDLPSSLRRETRAHSLSVAALPPCWMNWSGSIPLPFDTRHQTPLWLCELPESEMKLSQKNCRQKCPIPDSALPKYSWLPYHTICSYCRSLSYADTICWAGMSMGVLFACSWLPYTHDLMPWRWYHVQYHFRNCLLQNLWNSTAVSIRHSLH